MTNDAGVTAALNNLQQQAGSDVSNLPTPDYARTAINPDTGKMWGFNKASSQWEEAPDHAQPEAPEAPTSALGEFAQGIPRGIEQTGSLMYEGVPALAKGLANEAMTSMGMQAAFDPTKNLQDYMADVNKAAEWHPTKYGSYKDVHSLGDIPGFIAATAGEQVPNLALTFGSGALTGTLAKSGMKAFAAKAGEDLTDAELKSAFDKGMMGGLGGSMLAQNAPATYMDWLKQGKDDPLGAISVGALNTGIGMLPQMRIFEKILGPDGANAVTGNLLKNIGTEAAESAVFQGGTSAAQTMISDIANHMVVTPNQSLFTPDNINGLIDSTLKGTIGGAMYGGVTGGIIGKGQDILPGFMEGKMPSRKELDTVDAQMKNNIVGEKAVDNPDNPMDSSVVPPVYYNKLWSKADHMGIDKDSMQFIDPIKDGPILENIEGTIKNGEGKLDTLSVVNGNQATLDPAMKPQLVARNKDILEAKPRSDENFISGDGEMVADTPDLSPPQDPKQFDKSYQLSPLNDPYVRLQMQDGGNFESKVFRPQVLRSNLDLIPLTDEAQKSYKPFISGAERILREVVGSAAHLVPLDSIRDNLTDTPVLGAQFANVIALALNKSTEPHALESLYHEAWHFMERAGAVPDADKHTEKLLPYLDKDPYLSQFKDTGALPYDQLLRSPAGREEIRANAFGKWAVENATKGREPMAVPESLHPALRPLFRAGINFVRKFKNMLNGLGFNNHDDIFRSVYNGERKLNNPVDVVNNMNKELQIARLQNIATDVQKNHQEDTEKDDSMRFAESRAKANQMTDTMGPMSFYGRYLQSFQHAASRNPFINDVFQSFRQRIEDYNNYQIKYNNLLKSYRTADRATRARLHDIMNYNRETNQKATLDADGHLTFKANFENGNLEKLFPHLDKDTKIVKWKDPENSQRYMDLAKAYQEQLNDFESANKKAAASRYPELAQDGSYTRDHVEALRLSMDPAKQGKDIERMQELSDKLKYFEKLRKQDYVPHMQYGQWGITVRDKEGKQVDFFTIENGRAGDKFNKLYSKTQMDRTLAKLQEHYSDTSKYDVIGDKGAVKDFSDIKNIMPFKLTHSTLKSNVDPRFLNAELLSSLLHSRNINAAELEQFRQDIHDTITEKGFKARFTDDMGPRHGYSNDWDRVTHTSFGGSAHFFANLPHSQRLAQLHKEALALKDDVLKNKLIGADGKSGYIGYANSIQDDMQSLRTFNFLWAMGGNVSTALTQVYTLPTLSLGLLNQYNPNPINNMKTIAKWAGVAVKHFLPTVKKTIYSGDGLAKIDYSDENAIAKAIRSGDMTEAQASSLRKLSNSFPGASLADHGAGFNKFEGTNLSDFRNKLSKTAYYLGLPVALTEQVTRFATTMAAIETFENPLALERAKTALKDDYRFQSMMENRRGMSLGENLAAFTQDEAHGVYGKYGRAEFMRGIGGGVFLPFMTYQHQILETMARMYGHGPDGKRALGYTLGAMFMFCGMMGLPAADLLKFLSEKLHTQLTGHDVDPELMIREAMYGMTGSARAGKFVTHGITSAFGNMDVSHRWGLAIPGSDIAMMLMGSTDKPVQDEFGVAGSILPSIGNAWNSYNNDAGPATVLGSILPSTAGNLLKAYQMTTQGVRTQGKTPMQLMNPNEINASTVALRALGVGSDQVAQRRDELYYGKILPKEEFKVAVDRFRNQATNAMAASLKANTAGDTVTADKERLKYQQVIQNFRAYNLAHKIPMDLASFNRTVFKNAQQRQVASIPYQSLAKTEKPQFSHLQQVLGTERNE